MIVCDDRKSTKVAVRSVLYGGIYSANIQTYRECENSSSQIITGTVLLPYETLDGIIKTLKEMKGEMDNRIDKERRRWHDVSDIKSRRAAYHSLIHDSDE